mgnify:CR=1 FL=1
MLGKKPTFRKPLVVLTALVLLGLLNILVVNNSTFATRISDLTDSTQNVSEMQMAESDAQQKAMIDNEKTDADVQQTTMSVSSDKEQKEESMDSQFREGMKKFWMLTGFRNVKLGNLIMILVGILFIFLAIRFEFEPMLLIPIGTGIIIGNIPFFQGDGVNFQSAIGFAQSAIDSGAWSFDMESTKALLLAVFDGSEKNMVLSEAIKSVEKINLSDFGMYNIEEVKQFLGQVFESGELNLQTGLYQKGSVLNYLYFGVTSGIYPPLIFLGIGAMTDFSSLIANPKLMLLGAAAQIGVFLTFILALNIGFNLRESGAIGIIGGADGPTAIFLSSRLANGTNGTRNLVGPIAIAAYSYMALVPLIQPPIIRLLTSKKERLIRMKAPRVVSKTEKVMFPVIGLILTTFISPTALYAVFWQYH